MLLHRLEPDVLAGGAGDGIGAAQLLGDGVGLALRALDRHARFYPADHAPLYVVAVSRVVGDARGEPDIGELLHVGFRREEQVETRR